MNNLTFSVDREIFEKHPGFRRAIIVARDILNEGDLGSLINEQLVAVKALSPEDPRLVTWREAFALEGMKVRDFRPSIDALVKRIQADKPFVSINKIVDIGTIVSLKFVLPAGAHPILSDTQTVSMERASGEEIDVSFDGKTEPVPKGEIVLKDNGRLATRRWVWRQTPLSRIDHKTTSFFLNIDALPVISDEVLNEAIKFSQELIQSVFRVETGVVVLDLHNPTEDLS